jgi:xanthine dehydrogenase YagT iron-sulfur-binding subunit
MCALVIGERAPDFTLCSSAGELRRLSDFRGSPLIIVFHASGWDPARQEHVDTYNQLIARQQGPAGAALISVGGDGPWRAFSFGDHEVALPILDGEEAAAQSFDLSNESAVFVLDGDGIIRWRHVGDTRDDLGLARSVSGALAALGGAGHWSRREFVATMVGAAFAIALEPTLARAASVASVAHSPSGPPAPGDPRPVMLNVNGRDLSLSLEPRVTLLDALREYAGLTGTKKGCDHGQCGACTVHVDGQRTLSCLTFAVMQQGKRITTIEGLARGDQLHPVQQAFITHDGFQCGYCTSGQIMSATAMMSEPWGAGDDDVREAMSGNICRCGAYPGIVAAIQEVRGARRATQ